MTALLHTHSALRYLVLLAALLALAYLVYALATKKPYGKPGRVLPSVFVGLLDLQVLVGVATLLVTRRWYPAMWGHLVMMVAAAVVAHVLLVRNRRRARPGYGLPLAAVLVATVLVIGGIFAIGRSPLRMTVPRASAGALGLQVEAPPLSGPDSAPPALPRG